MPLADEASGLDQAGEPVLIQAFVTELAIEALNIAILHRLPGLDELQPNAGFERP